MKTILLGEEACKLYIELTNHEKYTGLQDELKKRNMVDLGLVWNEDGRFVAVDFCRGSEIHVEDFSDFVEAAKYASGLEYELK